MVLTADVVVGDTTLPLDHRACGVEPEVQLIVNAGEPNEELVTVAADGRRRLSTATFVSLSEGVQLVHAAGETVAIHDGSSGLAPASAALIDGETGSGGGSGGAGAGIGGAVAGILVACVGLYFASRYWRRRRRESDADEAPARSWFPLRKLNLRPAAAAPAPSEAAAAVSDDGEPSSLASWRTGSTGRSTRRLSFANEHEFSSVRCGSPSSPMREVPEFSKAMSTDFMRTAMAAKGAAHAVSRFRASSRLSECTSSFGSFGSRSSTARRPSTACNSRRHTSSDDVTRRASGDNLSELCEQTAPSTFPSTLMRSILPAIPSGAAPKVAPARRVTFNASTEAPPPPIDESEEAEAAPPELLAAQLPSSVDVRPGSAPSKWSGPLLVLTRGASAFGALIRGPSVFQMERHSSRSSCGDRSSRRSDRNSRQSEGGPVESEQDESDGEESEQGTTVGTAVGPATTVFMGIPAGIPFAPPPPALSRQASAAVRAPPPPPAASPPPPQLPASAPTLARGHSDGTLLQLPSRPRPPLGAPPPMTHRPAPTRPRTASLLRQPSRLVSWPGEGPSLKEDAADARHGSEDGGEGTSAEHVRTSSGKDVGAKVDTWRDSADRDGKLFDLGRAMSVKGVGAKVDTRRGSYDKGGGKVFDLGRKGATNAATSKVDTRCESVDVGESKVVDMGEVQDYKELPRYMVSSARVEPASPAEPTRPVDASASRVPRWQNWYKPGAEGSRALPRALYRRGAPPRLGGAVRRPVPPPRPRGGASDASLQREANSSFSWRVAPTMLPPREGDAEQCTDAEAGAPATAPTGRSMFGRPLGAAGLSGQIAPRAVRLPAFRPAPTPCAAAAGPSAAAPLTPGAAVHDGHDNDAPCVPEEEAACAEQHELAAREETGSWARNSGALRAAGARNFEESD
jgi:hypothetical protein